MRSMEAYPKAAMERAMKVQDVMLQAMAKRITWWQAAEIMGISDRHMRRWRERYEEFGPKTRKRDSFEVEIGELDVVLWAEAKEEECQGNDTARSRSSTPCGKSKGARRS